MWEHNRSSSKILPDPNPGVLNRVRRFLRNRLPPRNMFRVTNGPLFLDTCANGGFQLGSCHPDALVSSCRFTPHPPWHRILSGEHLSTRRGYGFGCRDVHPRCGDESLATVRYHDPVRRSPNGDSYVDPYTDPCAYLCREPCVAVNCGITARLSQ